MEQETWHCWVHSRQCTPGVDSVVGRAVYPRGWLCSPSGSGNCRPVEWSILPMWLAVWLSPSCLLQACWRVRQAPGTGSRQRILKWCFPALVPVVKEQDLRNDCCQRLHFPDEFWPPPALSEIRQDQHVVLTQAAFPATTSAVAGLREYEISCILSEWSLYPHLALSLNVSSSSFHRQTLWGLVFLGRTPMLESSLWASDPSFFQGGFLCLW